MAKNNKPSALDRLYPEMKLTKANIETFNTAVDSINKQMRRLVKHARETGDVGALNWAYRTAVNDTRNLRVDKGTRFVKLTKTRLKNEASAQVYMRRAIEAMKEFREKPTYEISGIKETYGKQAAKFSENFNVPLTADDLAGVFETGLWQTLISAGYGSETTRRMIGEIKQNAADLKKLRKQKKAMRFTPDSGEYADRLNELLDSDRSAARVLGRYLNVI